MNPTVCYHNNFSINIQDLPKLSTKPSRHSGLQRETQENESASVQFLSPKPANNRENINTYRKGSIQMMKSSHFQTNEPPIQ